MAAFITFSNTTEVLLSFMSERKKCYMNCSPDHCIYVMVDIDHGLINPKSNFIQIHLDINSKAI